MYQVDIIYGLISLPILNILSTIVTLQKTETNVKNSLYALTHKTMNNMLLWNMIGFNKIVSLVNCSMSSSNSVFLHNYLAVLMGTMAVGPMRKGVVVGTVDTWEIHFGQELDDKDNIPQSSTMCLTTSGITLETTAKVDGSVNETITDGNYDTMSYFHCWPSHSKPCCLCHRCIFPPNFPH